MLRGFKITYIYNFLRIITYIYMNSHVDSNSIKLKMTILLDPLGDYMVLTL
jgi:hypothetical protein